MIKPLLILPRHGTSEPAPGRWTRQASGCTQHLCYFPRTAVTKARGGENTEGTQGCRHGRWRGWSPHCSPGRRHVRSRAGAWTRKGGSGRDSQPSPGRASMGCWMRPMGLEHSSRLAVGRKQEAALQPPQKASSVPTCRLPVDSCLRALGPPAARDLLHSVHGPQSQPSWPTLQGDTSHKPV